MRIRLQHRRRCGVALLFAALLAALMCCCHVASADEEHARVATAAQSAAAKDLLREGMNPIRADQVKEGVYEIEAESSSSFFKIKQAELTVADGKMTAKVFLDSYSYPLVFMGTGEQAAAAPASEYIDFNRDEMSFTVPVEALDAEIDCAAVSKRRKQWYDRKLLFYAASLPPEALLVPVPVYGDPVKDDGSGDAAAAEGAAVRDDGHEALSIDLPDGEYSIEVNMTGGSGRASVSSPTWLIVKDGRAYARLLWSSSYYDYMIVDEVRYENQTDDGSNSVFVIPISAMDKEIPVIADTTAMGDPVEIEYHLTFYSATIGDKDNIPQEAAIKVLELALVIIVAGGILNYALKKRRKQ